MVSSLDEVQRAKAVLELCKEELRQEQLAFDPNIRVGIMIEIPSAVIIADILIEEVDFFSIGTNDLCQYTLAVDRMNKEVAYLYQPLHPGILRLIRQTVQAAHQANKEVGICGEMAGEALNTLVLIGLGVDELSMSPAVIPEIKSLIRQINYEEAKQITNLVLNCKSTDEINTILDMEVKKYAN
jgi:phosphotransferase system enzyme I (PtsI)